MQVPTDGWRNHAWNNRRGHFRLLAEMTGLNETYPSLGQLQELTSKVASEAVFTENIAAFLEAAGGDWAVVLKRLELIEERLGLLKPLPFMSLDGLADPMQFDGVAVWTAGTANWSELRAEQIRMALRAGARFRRIVCLGSSRRCGTPADRAHPDIRGIPKKSEPDERGFQRMLMESLGINTDLFVFPELPELNAEQKPLKLHQQLDYLISSGQYAELIGGADMYVPANPNALYVPLHVGRVLGHDNVWFSQAGARICRKVPDGWWPNMQKAITTPNGILRLWIELLHAGCITER